MPKTTVSPDNIDGATLIGTVVRAVPRIAIAALAVGGAVFGLLSMMAPRFQSEAQITIDAKLPSNPFSDPKQASASVEAAASRIDKEAINTHVSALKSPALAKEIIEKLDLAQRPEFNPAAGDVDTVAKLLRLIGLGGSKAGQSEQDRVLDSYNAAVLVFAARESRYISLRATSVQPQLAADIANAIGEAYRAKLASRQVEETQDVQDALGPKIETLVKDVAAAETAVDQFRGKIDAFAAGAQKQSLSDQQLTELTNELSKAQGARSEAEARAQAGRELLKRGSGDALPDVQKSPLIQNLVQQRVRVERQIAELNATLLPGHPRMQQLNADLNGLKKQITAEVAKIVDGLTREAKVAADRETSINKRLAALKVKVVDRGPDEAQLKSLVADAKAKRDELERLQAQFNANKSRVESKAVPVEAKIVSPATASSVPVFPKKGPLSGMAALATFVLGLALTVLRGVSSGARAAAPVRTVAAEPIVVPVAPKAPARPMFATKVSSVPAHYAADEVQMPASVASENMIMSIGELIERIAARTPERGGYRTLVTGEHDGADATATVVALVEGLAGTGQPVVLLEWSYGNSQVAVTLNVPGHPGMAELITGQSSFEEVISGVPGTTCHAIAAGRGLLKAFSSQDPNQINLVLDALDEAYAHIVVTGEYSATRQLFEAIGGRFDAGVVVTAPEGDLEVVRDPEGTFLGFEVADIDVVRFTARTPFSGSGRSRSKTRPRASV